MAKPKKQVLENGTRRWLVGGKRHRAGAPAVELPDGTSEWWLNRVKQEQPHG